MKKYLLLALFLVGCASAPTVITSDVPNLKPVTGDPGVYRSGQTLTPAGWNYVKNLGVSNVIKLNLTSEGSDNGARAVGLRVQHFPINGLRQVLLKPDFLLVSNAVTAVKPGTLIHCEHGQDRTGLIVGCLRVWRDGWSKDAARQEMLTNGFHTILHGLNDFWEDDVH